MLTGQGIREGKRGESVTSFALIYEPNEEDSIKPPELLLDFSVTCWKGDHVTFPCGTSVGVQKLVILLV